MSADGKRAWERETHMNNTNDQQTEIVKSC